MLVDRGSIKERINWTGILAGLVAGIGTQLALTALGVAIGAATIDSARGLALGTIAWLAVSLAISAFLAGLTAARAAGYLTPAQGAFNGLITGLLLTLFMTVFGFNALLGGVRTALGLAQGAATAVSNAAQGATNSAAQNGAAQSDPVQALLSGLNEQELNQIIAEGSPELSTEQVGAATNVVQGIVNRAANDVDLSNVSRLDEFATRRVDAISQALSGEQLVTRLERQGLSNAEAQETATVIRTRAREVRERAENTVATVERVARQTTSSAAWAFLLGAGLILAMSVLGGRRGHDVPPSGATVVPRDGDDGTVRQRA